MPITSFRELTVWQKSFQLVVDVYKFNSNLPKHEQFGLVSQMNRCAVSIPSNIAEGQQRNNRKEYRQFIGIAQGSVAELETQLLIAAQIYSVSADQILEKLHEIQKMLYALNKKLEPNT